MLKCFNCGLISVDESAIPCTECSCPDAIRYILDDKTKYLIYEIISDLDRHFPEEVLTDEYYVKWYIKYIKPFIT